MTIEHKRSSKAEIEDLVKARYSLIWISSAEEQRVEEQLRKLCVEREMRLEVWSITEGFKTVANGQGTRRSPSGATGARPGVTTDIPRRTHPPSTPCPCPPGRPPAPPP